MTISKFIKSKIYLVYDARNKELKELADNSVKAITSDKKRYIKELDGYIFKVIHNNKSVYFTLQKRESSRWWNLSELTTGASVGFSDFKTRDQAINYITEYDFDIFNKIFNYLQCFDDQVPEYYSLLADFNKNNMALLNN